MKDANRKEYSVNSKFLENEEGDPVSSKDLYIGSSVIWKLKGKPYKVVIVATSGNLSARFSICLSDFCFLCVVDFQSFQSLIQFCEYCIVGNFRGIKYL